MHKTLIKIIFNFVLLAAIIIGCQESVAHHTKDASHINNRASTIMDLNNPANLTDLNDASNTNI